MDQIQTAVRIIPCLNNYLKFLAQLQDKLYLTKHKIILHTQMKKVDFLFLAFPVATKPYYLFKFLDKKAPTVHAYEKP